MSIITGLSSVAGSCRCVVFGTMNTTVPNQSVVPSQQTNMSTAIAYGKAMIERLIQEEDAVTVDAWHALKAVRDAAADLKPVCHCMQQHTDI